MDSSMDNSVQIKRIEEFKMRHHEMLQAFASMEWSLSDDPDLAEFAIEGFEMFQEELPIYEKAVIQAARARSDPWIKQASVWEGGLPADAVVKQRTEFMACAMRKDVGEDYLVDCQKRWSNAEFTEVTDSHLVVGEIFSQRHSANLQPRLEKDLVSEFSKKGRQDLTYHMWEGGKFMEKVTAVRPKINGERFVLVQEKEKRILRGFKDWELVGQGPSVFVPKLVEYYAGEYYCIEPPIGASVKIAVVLSGSKREQMLNLRGHPWLSIPEYLTNRIYQNSHKYDGIMFQVGQEEVRAKFTPTGETEINGVTWEVSVLPSTQLIRPRQGKDKTPMGTLVSQLRSRLRAQYVIEYMHTGSVPVPVVQPIVPQADIVSRGVKAMVLTVSPDLVIRVVFIREVRKDGSVKPMDMIGGAIDLGESPMDAMIREMAEETGWVTTPDQYVAMGSSEGREDGKVWRSDLFLIYMPWKEVQCAIHPDLESFDIPVMSQNENALSAFINSARGEPRQIWFARNWRAVVARVEQASSLSYFYAYYMMMVPANLRFPLALSMVGPCVEVLYKQIGSLYDTKIMAYALRMSKSDPSLSYDKLRKLLLVSWPLCGQLEKKLEESFNVVPRDELVELVSSVKREDLVRLFKELFRENARVDQLDYLTPFHLRKILGSWGSYKSLRAVKGCIQLAIKMDVIASITQSNSFGGLVYRLK